MSADARIYIKVDVDNAKAVASLAATKAAIEKLSGSRKHYIDQESDLKRSLDRTRSAEEAAHKTLGDKSKAFLAASKAGHMFGQVGSSLAKIAKYGAIEFAGMTAVLGGLKLALLAGQWVMKGFHVSMLALGAAAGIAVAALSGLLGAMREVQVAKMSPQFKSVYGVTPEGSGPEASRYRSSRGLTNRTMGDQRFGMVSDAGLAQAMGQRLDQGQEVGSGFRDSLARLGDFAGGDEKKLLALNAAMSEGAKAGKINQSVYDQLVKTSPAFRDAFVEMAGSQKAADAAAANGSVSYEQFNKVLMDGKLKALVPYNGALNEINDTVMGKFKSGLRVVKEQLTGLSETSSKDLYGFGSDTSIMDAIRKPIDGLVLSLTATFNAIGPSILSVVPDMVGGMSGVIEKSTDKLVVGIVKGMGWLKSFSGNLNSWIGSIKGFFENMAAYLTKVTGPFDVLWKTILVPLGSFIVDTLQTAIASFSKNVGDNVSHLTAWGEAFSALTQIVESFFEVMSTIKTILTPLITVLSQVVKIIGAAFGNSVTGPILKFFAGVGLLYLLFRKVVNAFIEWRRSIMDSYGAMKKAEGAWQGLISEATLYQNKIKEIQALIKSGALNPLAPGGGGGKPGTGPVNPTDPNSKLPTSDPRYRPPGGGGGGTSGNGLTGPTPLMSTLTPRPNADQTIVDGMTGDTITKAGPGTMAKFKTKWRSVTSNFDNRPFLRRSDPNDPNSAMVKSINRREARAEARANETPDQKYDRIQRNRARAGTAMGMGLMMAGGLVSQYSGDNAVGQGIGQTISGAGAGGMLGAALGMEDTRAIGGLALASAGISLGATLGARAKPTDAKGKTIAGAISGGVAGAGVGLTVGTMLAPLTLGVSVPAATAIGGAIGTVIGGTVGYFGAQSAQRKEAKSDREFALNRNTKVNTNTIERLLNEQQDNKNDLVKLREGSARLKVLGKGGNQFIDGTNYKGGGKEVEIGTIDGRKGRIGDLETKIAAAKGDQKKLDTLVPLLKAAKDEKNALEEWTRNTEDQIEGYNQATKRLTKMGKHLKSNMDSGSFFGFDADAIAAYADRNGIALGEVQLSIKAMIELSGYGKDAMANFALSAKKTYEYLSKPFDAQREAAQAGIDSSRQVADYLAGSNQAKGVDATFLANTDVMNSISKEGTANLSAGVYGRGADSFTAFRGAQTEKIDRLLQETRDRPGVDKDTLASLELIAAATKTRLNEGMDFGTAFALDPTMGQSLLTMSTQSSNAVNTAVEGEKAGMTNPKSDKNVTALGKLQAKTVRQQAMDQAATMKSQYNLKETQSELADQLESKIVASMEDGGQKIYKETLDGLTKGSLTAGDSITKALSAMRLVVSADGKGWKWVSGGSGGGGDTIVPAPQGTAGNQSSGGLGMNEWALNQATWGATNGPAPAGFHYQGDGSVIPNDTPSSRFAQTLATHSRFDSMLPGKRTISSGLRNYGLGSLTSDHLTGGAFDLVGQNLGSYAQLMNQNGGFAEFHGSDASRHLHVVPPHGDTSGPVMTGSMSGGTTNHTYSIVVNGGPGSSPAAIAEEVMARIQRVQQNAMERY